MKYRFITNGKLIGSADGSEYPIKLEKDQWITFDNYRSTIINEGPEPIFFGEDGHLLNWGETQGLGLC